jgi:hypothetical protein
MNQLLTLIPEQKGNVCAGLNELGTKITANTTSTNNSYLHATIFLV